MPASTWIKRMMSRRVIRHVASLGTLGNRPTMARACLTFVASWTAKRRRWVTFSRISPGWATGAARWSRPYRMPLIFSLYGRQNSSFSGLVIEMRKGGERSGPRRARPPSRAMRASFTGAQREALPTCKSCTSGGNSFCSVTMRS
jgi:hypothetical protein